MNDCAALEEAKAARAFQIGDTAITINSSCISPPLAPAQVPAPAPDPIEVFRERCEARALLLINGQMSLHEAVDELQGGAERSGLIDAIGQDAVQDIMGAAFAAVDLLPDDEAFERKIFLCTAELVQQWEMADPRDRWRHTGEAPPKVSAPPKRSEPYRPAESTVAAFWCVVSLNDPEYLKAWLARHPDDVASLREMLDGKQ
jgi:hypothetical protein